MRFEIDPIKKKELQKRYLKTKPVMYWLPYVFFIAVAMFTVGFLIYGLAFEDTFVVTREIDPNYGEKDYFMIGAIIVGGDILLLFFGGIAKLAIWRVSGKYLSERVNETLAIKDNILEYGYQNFAGSVVGDRIIVKIASDQLEQVIFERKLEKIIFTGSLNSTYFEDYRKKQTKRAKEDLNQYEARSFVLFDYFDPSLVWSLKEQGLSISERE